MTEPSLWMASYHQFMSPESEDPTDIRALAVTGEDLVAALEMTTTSDRRAVLRVTPPFSGRMRARLHVVQDPPSEPPRPVRIPPSGLLESDAPPYPRPSETEDELRAHPDEEYSVERHREYHADAVDEWRTRVRSFVRDSVTLDTYAGETTVEVTVLG